MRKNLLFDIKELYQLIGKSMFIDNNKLPKYKPTATQIRFIDYLSKHSAEDITGKDLEKVFHISKATVSDVLNTMERHKIIIRVVSSVDTRMKKIILNDEYKKLHKKFNREVIKMQSTVTKGISDEELDIFNKTLNKMKENIYNFFNEDNDS